jgi:TRAP-type C4-dicarboxylate transport system permease small subunit
LGLKKGKHNGRKVSSIFVEREVRNMGETKEKGGSRGFMERGIIRLEQCCTLLASFSLIVMLVIIAAGTLARYFFNRPLSFVDEYSGYLLIIMGFLAISSALRRDAHIGVEIVRAIFPERMRSWLDTGVFCLAVLIATTLFWIGLELCWESYSTHTVSSTIMETPLWIPQLFIPLGWAAFILLLLIRIKNNVWKVENPNGAEGTEKMKDW